MSIINIDWSETKGIIAEVEQLYSRDEDLRDISDIKKMANEIDLHCSSTMIDAKELIKQLTNRVTAKEQEIYVPSEDAHKRRLLEANDNKLRLVSELNDLHDSIEKKSEYLVKLQSDILNQCQLNSSLEKRPPIMDSRTTYALSLYGKITNISWDYQATPGHLAGYIGNDMTKQLFSFDFDTSRLDSFEKANKLWDMIGDNIDGLLV